MDLTPHRPGHGSIERRLYKSVMSGQLVDARQAQVKADLIRRFALGVDLPEAPYRLRLKHARIVGELDFRATTLLCPLELDECTFEGIDLKQAAAPAIYLNRCEFGRFEATQLSVRHSLSLHGSHVRGRVNIQGADIGGTLDLDGTRILKTNHQALLADGVHVHENFTCGNGFLAEGYSSMVGGRIDGQFKASGGKYINPGQVALSASSLQVMDHMVLGKGFYAEGDVCLDGSHIQGRFDCDGAHFRKPQEFSLSGVTMKVEQGVHFGQDFQAKGTVNLTGAQIGGSLDCTGGHFIHSGRIALDLARADIKQHALFQDGFTADGQVILHGAMIGGSLSCEGGHIRNRTNGALLANNVTVGGDVALSSRSFGVHQKDKGFVADGEVSLIDSTIKGDLNCKGGRFSNGGGKRFAITAPGCRMRSMQFDALSVVRGSMDLRRCMAGELADDGFRWPKRVLLRRFVYDTLAHPKQPTKAMVDQRIKWLQRNGEYVPQIYRHLANVYYSEGRPHHAERVLVAEEAVRRRSWWEKLRGWFFWATVGYGFSPLRIVIWLVALWIVGGLLFASLKEDLTPIPKDGITPERQSWLYTLDLLLPVINLKQRDQFIVKDAGLWYSTAFTITGWILGTVLLVGIHNVLKRSK